MVGVLVTGHGNFATGLKTSVELIAGASDYFKYVDFPGDSTEKLAADQHKALDELKDCDGVTCSLQILLAVHLSSRCRM